MARKQNGGYNASISVLTLIFHLVVNSTRLKTDKSALWRRPNSTVALRVLENVVNLTNLEVVKIEFRHLPVHVVDFFLKRQPSALTRAVLKTKLTRLSNAAVHSCAYRTRFLSADLQIKFPCARYRQPKNISWIETYACDYQV